MLNGSQKQVIKLVFLADVGNLVCSGDHCVQTDPANTFRSIQCEQFKEKLSEIRGWGQADRHFAAHYRLFLN
jgi:hypothetical protein